MPGVTIHGPHSVLQPVRGQLWASFQPLGGATLGTRSQWSLTVLTSAVHGVAFTITYGSTAITMQCVSGIAEDALGPTQFQPTANASQAATAILNACLRNYALARDFSIIRTGTTITFTQRTLQPVDSDVANAEFALASWSSAPLGFVSCNPIVSGLPPVPVPNHSVRYAILAQRNGTWERLAEQSCAVVRDITPAIDLAGQLLGALRKEAIVPPAYDIPFGGLQPQPATGISMPFYLQAVEVSGGQPTPGRVWGAGSEATPLLAWRAGFDQAGYRQALNFCSRLQGLEASTEKPFWFTYRRGQHVLSARHRHYLTHYNWGGLSGGQLVHLEALVRCTDGSTTGWSSRYSTSSYPYRQLSVWPTGFDHLNCSSLVPSGKRAASYEVRLRRSDGAVLTEIKRWQLAHEDYQEVQLIWLNSLGGWEALRCTGAWSRSVQATHVLTTRPSVLSDHGKLTVSRDASETGGLQRSLSIANTGYLPLAEHQLTVEILSSPAIFLVDHERGVHLPMHIAKSKEVDEESRGDQDEHLYTLQLELLRGHPEQVITGRVPVMEYALSP